MNREEREIIVGISGASGAIIASKTVDNLLSHNIVTSLVISNPGKMVWHREVPETFGEALERWSSSELFKHYAIGDLAAPIASGSHPSDGMVIVPASMGTIAAISTGMSNNLLRRAADVCLKEKRPLVLVPRESPLHSIHLDHMAKLAHMNVTILPSDPPFYLPISTIDESADFTASRILLALDVISELPSHMQYKP